MVNKEQNRLGNWTSRGRMTTTSESVAQTGSESWYQSNENRETTIPHSPVNTTALGNNSEQILPAEDFQLPEDKTTTENPGENGEHSTKSHTPVSIEKAKSAERLEITTTLPDINMSQS